jgi:hypothetical protein
MDWLLILSSLLLPVVPLFFFPGCVCCTGPCPTICSGASPFPVTVTISGWSNNVDCLDCADLDATYVVNENIPPLSLCRGNLTPDDQPCVVFGCINGVLAEMIGSGGDTLVRITQLVNHSGGAACDPVFNPNKWNKVVWEYNLGTSPQTCEGVGTVMAPHISTTGTLCTHDASDAEVVL